MSASPLCIRRASPGGCDAWYSREWSFGVPTATWLDREAAFRDGDSWVRGRRQLWTLSRGDEALASCETYLLSPAHAAAAAPHAHGVLHGFASVFVNEGHRRRGHASALLRGVMEALEREHAPEAAPLLGFVLFSDVGDRLYAPLGFSVWERGGVSDWVSTRLDTLLELPALLLLEEQAPPRSLLPAAADSSAQPLRVQLPLGDTPQDALIEVELLPGAMVCPSDALADASALRVSPDPALLRCWLRYGRGNRALLREGARLLRYHTAVLPALGGACCTFNYNWAHDIDELCVLALSAGEPGAGGGAAATRALLRLARGVAAAAGLARVRIWETGAISRALEDAAAGEAEGAAWQREARDGSVPMFCPSQRYRGVISEWVDVQAGMWL